MNITGLSTGFAKLDEKIMGFKPGEITVIASRPGVGKTTFAMNIVECVALGQDIKGDAAKYDGGKRHPVLYFSLEVPANALVSRLLANRARVGLWRSRGDADIDKERFEMKSRLVDAGDVLHYAPIFIEDDKSVPEISVICEKAREAKRLHNVELIVIDYLEFIKNRGFATRSRMEQVSSIVTGLKELAVELSIHVILLAQLSFSQPNGRDKKPTFSDLRSFPDAKQIADIVMFLHRPPHVNGEVNKDRAMAFVDIAKNSHGETGEVPLIFCCTCQSFFEQP